MADLLDQVAAQSAPQSPPTGDLLDQVAAAQPQSDNPSAHASISATPPPQGFFGHMQRWAENVADDIKYGTDLTGVGTVLQKMGAHGVYVGQPEKVGDFMASLPLGLLRAAKGEGEMGQGKFGQGGTDYGAGLLQASTIPSTFVGGPEAAEVGQAGVATKALGKTADATGAAASKINELIPSVERAAGNFQQVMKVAKDVPINTNTIGDSILRFKDLQDRGGKASKVVTDLLKRLTDPEKGAMTYDEARDFYSNLAKYTRDQASLPPAQRLPGEQWAVVNQLKSNMDQALTDAAGSVNKGALYQAAMSEYAKAMRLRLFFQQAKATAMSKLGRGVAEGAGLGAAYSVVRSLFGGGK